MREQKHTLYKIYYGNKVVYVGRTNQTLQARLHGHFFKKPMHRDINIELVTKIEYAEFPTVADMYLYEIYYINKLKPQLNKDDKARDKLTVKLPEVKFKEYTPPLMGKWRAEIMRHDTEHNRHEAMERERAEKFIRERKQKRKQLAAGEITQEAYEAWIAERGGLFE